MGVLFVAAGSSKLFAPAATAAVIASRNLPAPMAIGLTVGLFEFASGVLLILGWKIHWVTLVLAALVVVAAGIFHFPVVLAGPRALEIGMDAGVLMALYVIATRRPGRDID